MKIEFDKIGTSVLEIFKGGEKELSADMFFDGTNRIFKGRLIPGASIGLHTHDDSCEVIFILSGTGTLTEISPAENGQDNCGTAQDANVQTVTAGDCLYCPKGHTHSLKNTATESDLIFHAVVARQ